MRSLILSLAGILSLVLVVSAESAWAQQSAASSLPDSEQNVFNLDVLRPYGGSVIHEIHIQGLKRTRERALRWLLSQREGDAFAPETWIIGIHKLYDTTVIYGVSTEIRRVGENQIDIELHVNDRWTLLPFGIAQAGGGSNNLGGGIADVNFLGYFTQFAVSYSIFNGVASYDLNFYQEFFLDTEFIWGLDISNVGNPVELQADNGSSLGNFTWARQQEQLLIGHKYSSGFEPKIRLFSYIEYFRDEIVTNSGAPEVRVYSLGQYRFRPTLVLGRSELTNFLEQGQEITVAPTSANFFDSHHTYSQIVATFKHVWLEGNTNYAIFLNAGAMTRAPIPYLFHLGGYDTVRGFSTYRGLARYYLNDSLEYRPHLARFPMPWIGDMVVQGALFTDGGWMWNSSDLSETRRVNSRLGLLSAGAGLRLSLMRFAGAIVRVDAAQTLSPREGWGASLGVGQFF